MRVSCFNAPSKMCVILGVAVVVASCWQIDVRAAAPENGGSSAIPMGSVEAWVSDFSARVRSGSVSVEEGRFPSRVAVVDLCAVGNLPWRFIEQLDEAGSGSKNPSILYLDMPDVPSSLMTFRLNYSSGSTQIDALRYQILVASKSDLLVTRECSGDEEGRWGSIWQPDFNKKTVTEVPATCPGLAGSSLAQPTTFWRLLGQCLRAALGYDGVVMEQKADLVLVRAAPTSGLPSGPDALALGGGAGAVFLATAADGAVGNRDGEAYLKLVKADNNHAVFRVVSSRTPAPLGFGTKVLIEKVSSTR